MKTIIYTLVILLGIGNAYAQLDTRATCKSNNLTIEAYAKPFSAAITFPNSQNNISMNVSFSLPANGAPNTSNAPIYISATTPWGLAVSVYPVFLLNDRFVYTCLVSGNVTTPIPTWAVNSENLIMQMTFGSPVNGQFPRLDNLLNEGPTGNDYFFFQVNGTQRSDTEGEPFYNGTEGTYGSGDLWVQAVTPLPIKLISFSAEKNGEKNALLNWTTASESNSDYFGIERSFDKVNWKTVGQVKAAGNSQIVLNYDFLDKDVYNGITSSLNVYYRLRMTDRDDAFSYSPIASVLFGKPISALANSKDFLVYPNPATEGLHVQWDADQVNQPTALEFFDISGKLVYTQKVEDQTDQQYVDFTRTNIQSGLYMIRVMSNDEAVEYKQIVVGQNH